MKRKITIGIFALIILVLAGANFIFAQESIPTVCCERTTDGLYCQNVQEEQCAADSRKVPTSCESTSYCKLGTCFDSSEGTCIDNTPQLVCNQNDGVWAEESPEQCRLGCCVLGDQASFVTLTRCKKLSSFLGLETTYDRTIDNEVQCILSVAGQEKGACVYEREFQRGCRFTTRAECNSGIAGAEGEFFPGKLCSAEELATTCGPTERTTCVEGKEEVYFVDTCGNPANIYDSSKINNKEYWSNVKDKSESCNVNNNNNAESKTCGNCNYILGSICREATSETEIPRYGDFICADLNCEDENGEERKHGESWCVYEDDGPEDESDNSIGSRFYKHICVNGEVNVEQCADFRQEICIEDFIDTEFGPYSQAGCIVNRWRDCTMQDNKQDCENLDRRICRWLEGVKLLNISEDGSCIPAISPGLKFWEGEDAKVACGVATAKCVVKFQKGLFGGWKCKENCECLTDEWEDERDTLCSAVGDCGVETNWIGEKGFRKTFNVTRVKVR